MTFEQQLIITLLDKAAIGLLLLFGGFLLNRVLENFKSKKAFENERAKLRDLKKLDYLEKQLSLFYWPLYVRLHADNNFRELISRIKTGDLEMKENIASEIEKSFIIPNQEEVIRIIQSNIHLMEGNTEAFRAMRRCIRHAAIYKAMRAAGFSEKDPFDLGEPWPTELLDHIRDTAYKLQKQYDLLAETNDKA